jgi:hypothetical protein
LRFQPTVQPTPSALRQPFWYHMKRHQARIVQAGMTNK